MSLSITTEPVPLLTDKEGVVRVNGTRVTLDTVVMAFNEGATAEEIVHQYPSLQLADVYASSVTILGSVQMLRPIYVRGKNKQIRHANKMK